METADGAPAGARIEVLDGGVRVLGAMVMRNARRLLASGREHFQGGQQLVDLSGVTQADSSGLAVLLEWQRLQQARGGCLRLAGVPAGLQSLSDLYGLDALLVPADPA